MTSLNVCRKIQGLPRDGRAADRRFHDGRASRSGKSLSAMSSGLMGGIWHERRAMAFMPDARPGTYSLTDKSNVWTLHWRSCPATSGDVI